MLGAKLLNELISCKRTRPQADEKFSAKAKTAIPSPQKKKFQKFTSIHQTKLLWQYEDFGPQTTSFTIIAHSNQNYSLNYNFYSKLLGNQKTAEALVSGPNNRAFTKPTSLRLAKLSKIPSPRTA